jgi:three-Cys-motif partner protein
LDGLRTWSQVKHVIVRKYIQAYSTLIAAQPGLKHVYVDAFAGAGMLENAETGEESAGSPIIALEIKPPFHDYHFIELDERKARILREHVGERGTVHTGDCNEVLLNSALPLCRWDDHRRGFWLLDAYGMHYDWEAIAAAGAERGVEILLNWPIHDINRNAAWRDPLKLDAGRLERMRRFWGDDSWRDAAYVKQFGLFGGEPAERKVPYTRIIDAYRDRLRRVAGFPFVPRPLPVRGEGRQPLYYLVFASHNATGAKIAGDVFRKHARDADRGSLLEPEDDGC